MTATHLTQPDRLITINADMGEGIAIHSFGNDDALLSFVDTINLACGMHAGGPNEMSSTVEKALVAGVTIGAHPGLPDLAGFGRRYMALDPEEVRELVLYQVGALTGFLRANGAPLHHIKPHGALYEMVTQSEPHMEAICDVAEIYGVPKLGLTGTRQENVAKRRGIQFVAEFYADLDYNDDGSVIVARRASSRNLDDVEQRIRRALERGKIQTVTGKQLPIRVESLCVHSDIPNAPAVAERIRSVLDSHLAGIEP
ncbi:5-oxoprolinase subunit PxpA [Cryobacterium sp. Hz9]|uniref:5-oxoprolinase subunit PxpA n=1 Tax=Cryobacterium sp. Hz9 TaxID=1259167 RepID=UPI00106D2B2A|nr:5-oxoprolinase subunit PxpA [Cryobacterium sp. Hz9]TFB67975.1 LamB/YcsF family protein [Cryobacterium sp. Hz9]